jgi:hypothetical protein
MLRRRERERATAAVNSMLVNRQRGFNNTIVPDGAQIETTASRHLPPPRKRRSCRRL